MIGKSKEHVRQSIIIADHMDKYPTLFEGAKTKADATKVVKLINETILKDEIVRRIKLERETEPEKDNLADHFILESFFHGVASIEEGSINLVEIDPPYGIDLHKAKKTKGGGIRYGDSYNEVDRLDYPTFLLSTFKAAYKVMAEHSWLICWFAPEPWFNTVYRLLLATGFTTTRMCGQWTKPTGQNKRPELNLANSYEMFFYAKKGSPAIAKARGNVFTTPPIPPQKKVHDTERPIELTTDIYSTFAFPGSKVLIPFLGSGNGLISARELDMEGIGFELGREFKDSFLIKTYK